jgi:hypothetical protein
MPITCELTYDINKYGNAKREAVEGLARRYGCARCDCLYEFEGKRHVDRSHCVLSVVFDDDSPHLEEFRKNVSGIGKVYLECVYNSENEILYASKYFKKHRQTLAGKRG